MTKRFIIGLFLLVLLFGNFHFYLQSQSNKLLTDSFQEGLQLRSLRLATLRREAYRLHKEIERKQARIEEKQKAQEPQEDDGQETDSETP